MTLTNSSITKGSSIFYVLGQIESTGAVRTGTVVCTVGQIFVENLEPTLILHHVSDFKCI